MTDDTETEIPVNAVDDTEAYRDDFESAIEQLTGVDPDGVALFAVVAVGNDRYEDPAHEDGSGFTFRLVNPDPDTFDDLRHMLGAIEQFNQQVDNTTLDLDGARMPSAGVSLSDLMGGER